MLTVDPAFDADTEGWGVIAFSTVASAFAAGGTSDIVVVAPAGDGVGGEVVIDATTPSKLVLIGSYISDVYFSISGGMDLTILGSGIITAVFGQNLFSITGSSSIIVNDGGLRLNGGDPIGNSIIDVDGTSVFDLSNCVLDASTYKYINGSGAFASGSQLRNVTAVGDVVAGAATVLDAINCELGGIGANVTLDPLNQSNSVLGVPYREIVAVSSLPAAAAGNAGTLAATSDGGTASAPALLYSNGSAWVVAAE